MGGCWRDVKVAWVTGFPASSQGHPDGAHANGTYTHGTWLRRPSDLEFFGTAILLLAGAPGGDWNLFYELPFRWECHHPNWLSYFSEGYVYHQPEMNRLGREVLWNRFSELLKMYVFVSLAMRHSSEFLERWRWHSIWISSFLAKWKKSEHQNQEGEPICRGCLSAQGRFGGDSISDSS